MSKLLKQIGLALTALIIPTIGWAEETLPKPVLLLDFGGTTATNTTDTWVKHTQSGGGAISPSIAATTGYTATFATTSGGNFYANNVNVNENTKDFTEGEYVDLKGNTHSTIFAEMAATLGMKGTIDSSIYQDGVGNGGFRGHTVTIGKLDTSKTYVMYYVAGGEHGNAGRVLAGFKLTGYAGVPKLDYVVTGAHTGTGTTVATEYQRVSNITSEIKAGANSYMVARVSYVQPNASGNITFQLHTDSDYAAINAFAIAEIEPLPEAITHDREINSADETWDTASEWTNGTLPVATDIVNLTATVEGAKLTIDTAAEIDQLTIGGEYALAVTGDKTLTVNTSTAINTDVDVSGAKASLGATTIASGKTLTIGANGMASVANNANSGTIHATGGTAAAPVVINVGIAEGDDPGDFTVAAGAYLRLHAEGGNKVYKVTGNGGTSHVILTSGKGWGVKNNDNSLISNCVLEIPQKIPGTDTNNSDFWLTPSRIGDDVHLVIGTDRVITTENVTTELRLASLSGEGKFHDSYCPTTTFKITNGSGKTFSGTIKGDHSVVKEGAGEQIFSGANTYSGTTTISGGTLQVAGGSLGTGTITVNANLTYTADATVANTIDGSGTITVDGKTLNLSGANVEGFTGSYSIVNNGTLVLKAGMEEGITVPAEGATLKIVVTPTQIAEGYTSTVASGSVTFVKEDGSVITENVEDNTLKPSAITWIGASGGAWDDDANWEGGVAPGAQNSVVFELTEALAVTIPDGGAAVNLLMVNGAKLTLTGGTLTATDLVVTSALETPVACIECGDIDLTDEAVLTLDAGTTNVGRTTQITGGTVVKKGTALLTLYQPAAGVAGAIFDGTTVQIIKGNLKLEITNNIGDPWIKDTTFDFADGTSLQQYGWIHSSGTITLNADEGVSASAFGTNLAESSTLKKTGAGTVAITVSNYPGAVNVEAGTLVHNGGTLSGTVTVAAGAVIETTADATMSAQASDINGTLKVTGGTLTCACGDRKLDNFEVDSDATLKLSFANGDVWNYDTSTTGIVNGTLEVAGKMSINANNKLTLGDGAVLTTTREITEHSYDFFANNTIVVNGAATIKGLFGTQDAHSSTLTIQFAQENAKLTIEDAAIKANQTLTTALAEGVTSGALEINSELSTEKTLTIAEGVTLSGTGKWGGPVTLADGAVIAAPVTVGGNVTIADGATVRVTGATVGETFLTYTGDAPANVGSIYQADGLYATALSFNGVTSISFVDITPPSVVEGVLSAEEAALAAQIVADALAITNPEMVISEIKNPGVPSVIEGYELALADNGNNTYTATFTYTFGVSKMAIVTIDSKKHVVFKAELGKGLRFADGVTISLDGADGTEVTDMTGTTTGTSTADDGIRYIRTLLPTTDGLKVKVKATKTTSATK